MQPTDLLQDAIGRIRGLVRGAAEGLSPDALAFRPTARANSIAWLLWHVTRVQDAHVADIVGADQLWVSGHWSTAFGLAADPSDTGYGHSSEQVAAIRPEDRGLLIGYHDAVSERTVQHLMPLGDRDLDHIVDRSYNPPVSVGVRLTRIVVESLQHVGQAHYVRGLIRETA